MSPAKAAGMCSKSCQCNRTTQQVLLQLQGYAVSAANSIALHSKSCKGNNITIVATEKMSRPEVCQLSMQGGQGFRDSPLALSFSQGTSQIGPFCMS